MCGPLPYLSPTLKGLRYAWFFDPESSYAAVAPTARIKHFRSMVAPSDYKQFVAHLPLHQAHLMAYGSSDVHFFVEDVPLLHLTACFGGCREVRTPHGDVESRIGEAALLPPGDREAQGACSTAVLSLRPQEAGKAAAAMAGKRDGGEGSRWGWPRFRPLGWGADTPEARQIHQLVHFVDRCAAVDPILPVGRALAQGKAKAPSTT